MELEKELENINEELTNACDELAKAPEDRHASELLKNQLRHEVYSLSDKCKNMRLPF